MKTSFLVSSSRNSKESDGLNIQKSPISNMSNSSSKTNKGIRKKPKSKSSSSSVKSWGDDIFPDYSVNYGSINLNPRPRMFQSSKENNSQSRKKENYVESLVLGDNMTKTMQSASEFEGRSEEEGRESRIISSHLTSQLDDISESSIFIFLSNYFI